MDVATLQRDGARALEAITHVVEWERAHVQLDTSAWAEALLAEHNAMLLLDLVGEARGAAGEVAALRAALEEAVAFRLEQLLGGVTRLLEYTALPSGLRAGLCAVAPALADQQVALGGAPSVRERLATRLHAACDQARLPTAGRSTGDEGAELARRPLPRSA